MLLDELLEVGEAVLRAGSGFFRIDAFGRTGSSTTRAGVGAGEALDDSLDSLDSLLAERVTFFCDGAGVPALTAEDCRERLERSESS